MTTLTPFPSWSQLNFSRNCTAYGQWLSTLIAPNTWNKADTLSGSITTSIELFNSAIPDGWVFTSNASGTPTNFTLDAPTVYDTEYFGDVLQWFTTHLYSAYNATEGQWYADADFVNNAVWDPADKCPNEFCKAIAFTGNADLSGIGVIISYYIESSLATLYLVVFTAWRIKKWMKRQRKQSVPDKQKADAESVAPRRSQPGLFRRALGRLFDALRGSLDSFHMTTTVFAFAVLVAAIIMAAKHAQDHRRHPVDFQNLPSGSALYDSALGLLVGLYSVFPVVTLYALLPQQDEVMAPKTQLHDRGGRTDMRRGVLVILWALAAALVYITPSSELDYEFQGYSYVDGNGDTSDFADALYACDQRGGRKYWRVLSALKYLVIGVPLLWAIITGALYLLTLKWSLKSLPKTQPTPQPATPSRRPTARNAWRHLVAWFNCAIMWTILGCLTSLRQDIVEVADGLDSESNWAFGQILSIATWGPVAVDFAFLIIFGIEDGLGGRLPLDFTIRQLPGGSTSPSPDTPPSPSIPSSPSMPPSPGPYTANASHSKTDNSQGLPCPGQEMQTASVSRPSSVTQPRRSTSSTTQTRRTSTGLQEEPATEDDATEDQHHT